MASSFFLVTQAKNVGNKSRLLFLTSHIQYPSGNPEVSIFKIPFKIQSLYTISTTSLWSKHRHLLQWLFQDIPNRPWLPPCLLHSLFSTGWSSHYHKIRCYLVLMLCAKVSKVVSTMIRMKTKVLTVQKGPHDLYSTPLVIAMVFSPIVLPAILTLLQPHPPPHLISRCQPCSLLWAYVPGKPRAIHLTNFFCFLSLCSHVMFWWGFPWL